MSRPKDCTSTVVVIFNTASCFRKNFLFKRFKFSVHKAASTVEYAYLNIAMVTASAGGLLQKQLSSNIEV